MLQDWPALHAKVFSCGTIDISAIHNFGYGQLRDVRPAGKLQGYDSTRIPIQFFESVLSPEEKFFCSKIEKEFHFLLKRLPPFTRLLCFTTEIGLVLTESWFRYLLFHDNNHCSYDYMHHVTFHFSLFIFMILSKYKFVFLFYSYINNNNLF